MAWARGRERRASGIGLPGAAAGADAIVIVAIPRLNVSASPLSPQFNFFDPDAPLDFWGHTAVYVRQGGRIAAVRGFNPATGSPAALLDLLATGSRVKAGQGALPGVLSSDAYLFTSNAARSLEYPVSTEQLTQFLSELPEVGPGGGPGVPRLHTPQPPHLGDVAARPRRAVSAWAPTAGSGRSVRWSSDWAAR